MILASYAAILLIGIAIGIAIGRGRNAKVRSEIARLGAMVREATTAKNKGKTP